MNIVLFTGVSGTYVRGRSAGAVVRESWCMRDLLTDIFLLRRNDTSRLYVPTLVS